MLAVAVGEPVLFGVEFVLHTPQETLPALPIIPFIKALHECVLVVVHKCYPALT